MPSIREETLPCLLCSPCLPWRHCLSCFYVGPLPPVSVRPIVVCCFPWHNFADGEASKCLPPVRSHSSSLLCFSTSSCQSAVNLTYERERRGGRKGKVMAFGVRTVRWAPDWKMVQPFSFSCQHCQVEQAVTWLQITSSLMSAVKLNHRIHRNIKRRNTATVLSASLQSQWFRFHSHITPDGGQNGTRSLQLLLVIAAVCGFTDNFIGSLGTCNPLLPINRLHRTVWIGCRFNGTTSLTAAVVSSFHRRREICNSTLT